MIHALTRPVSPSIINCQLSFIDRQPIDFAIAQRQHADYEQALTNLGAQICRVPAAPQLPDACFVEDNAVVLDEIAVICAMGTESRRPEIDAVAAALMPYRKLARLTPPATLEGGDVLAVGRTLYVGMTARTNEAGIAQLRAIVQPFGYEVRAVNVTGCLHLKSACAFLGRDTILINPDWIDPQVFSGFSILDVPVDEPMSADILRIGETLVFPKAYVSLSALLRDRGFTVQPVDLSEFQKAEGGPTCLSVLFER